SSYMPAMFVEGTVSLEDLHYKFPAYELKGPESFGKFLEPDEIEQLVEERLEDWLDGLFEPEEVEAPTMIVTGNIHERKKMRYTIEFKKTEEFGVGIQLEDDSED